MFDLRRLNVDPATVSFDELYLLVQVLAKDPSSWLQAALHDWKHPASYEWIMLANLYDAYANVNSKNKHKPVQRPWPSAGETKIGTARRDARDILTKAKEGQLTWHNKPTPTSH